MSDNVTDDLISYFTDTIEEGLNVNKSAEEIARELVDAGNFVRALKLDFLVGNGTSFVPSLVSYHEGEDDEEWEDCFFYEIKDAEYRTVGGGCAANLSATVHGAWRDYEKWIHNGVR